MTHRNNHFFSLIATVHSMNTTIITDQRTDGDIQNHTPDSHAYLGVQVGQFVHQMIYQSGLQHNNNRWHWAFLPLSPMWQVWQVKTEASLPAVLSLAQALSLGLEVSVSDHNVSFTSLLSPDSWVNRHMQGMPVFDWHATFIIYT